MSILRLIEQEKAVVEGAGATGLAAIIQGLVPELKGKKSVDRERETVREREYACNQT